MIDQAQELRVMMNKEKNKHTKIITITSGKGGVGKSSFALNMAISLSKKGKRVLIIDADFGFSNIDVMLGVSTKYDFMDVIRHQKSLRDIIEEGFEGVQFVSGGSGIYELTQLDPKQLMLFVNNLIELEDVADTIIFDTGAGITNNALRLMRASHETILVTTPEPTAVMDAYALIKIVCEKAENPNISLVLNKAENLKEALSVMDGLIRIAKKYTNVNINKLGYIMRDTHMLEAIKMQVPVLVSYPKCIASINIDQIVNNYLNMPVKQSKKLGIVSFLNNFLMKKN